MAGQTNSNKKVCSLQNHPKHSLSNIDVQVLVVRYRVEVAMSGVRSPAGLSINGSTIRVRVRKGVRYSPVSPCPSLLFEVIFMSLHHPRKSGHTYPISVAGIKCIEIVNWSSVLVVRCSSVKEICCNVVPGFGERDFDRTRFSVSIVGGHSLVCLRLRLGCV